MTQKLYYQDSHIEQFTAQVISCAWDEKKGYYAVVLDQTGFFPEEGGDHPLAQRLRSNSQSRQPDFQVQLYYLATVTSGKLVNLSEPQFPYLKSRNNTSAL